MNVKEIRVNTLMKTITKKDTLFHGKYAIDTYQNCSFGCIYCDSIQDETIYVKINAPAILKKELKNKPEKRIIIGSVHDPYQPVEQTYHITEKALSILSQTNYPVHILTKSTRIIDDIQIIKNLTNPIITFTVLGLNYKLWKTIEPFTPSPKKRLQTMKTLSNQKIKTGIAIIPIFPFFKDQHITKLIELAKKHQASYVLYKPLFLQGYQKDLFLKKIKKPYPHLHQQYTILYKNTPRPSSNIIESIMEKIEKKCNDINLPTSIPT